MNRTFIIAKNVIEEYLEKKEPFTYANLQQTILDRGGILRIAPGVSIGAYLRNLEYRNIIFYNLSTQKFDFTENTKNLETLQFDKIDNLQYF